MPFLSSDQQCPSTFLEGIEIGHLLLPQTGWVHVAMQYKEEVIMAEWIDNFLPFYLSNSMFDVIDLLFIFGIFALFITTRPMIITV